MADIQTQSLMNIAQSLSTISTTLYKLADLMDKQNNILMDLLQDKRYAADNKPDKEEKCA
jgi:hypothetical protein